jgi:predicted phosphodiesterase
VVVHAGDWVDVSLLDRVEARSRTLLGVYGNNDGRPCGHGCPRWPGPSWMDCGVAVVHETGDAKGRDLRCRGPVPRFDVLFFGHSHIPWDSNNLRRTAPAEPGLAHTTAGASLYATYLTPLSTVGSCWT